MQQLFLIGHPIGHSVSPSMQNAALRSIGLGWNYDLLDATPAELAGVIARLRADDCAGANVTIPHKQAIVEWLDDVTPRAHTIGAVNTIIKEAGKLIGDNTDGYGFATSLRDKHVDVHNKRVVVLGAGGAARAVAVTAAQAGAKRITILNRSMPRAQALADFLRAGFPAVAIKVNDGNPLSEIESALSENESALSKTESALSQYESNLSDAQIIVNATPVGMSPYAAESPMRGSFPAGAVAVDLVYRPLETCFLRQAAQAGAQTIGGLGMLVQQGAEAFRLWTGRDAPVDLMFKAARDALKGA